MSGAVPIETPVLRRFADGQLLNLSKLVIESALQPIVELSTGKVFGYETLLRGHGRLGFASPLELLDTAEEAGQLLAIEQMLSARALAKFATVPDFAHATLFINLDGRLIRSGGQIVDRMLQQLRQAEIPPSSVCFELTERFDNTSAPEFAALMKRMRQAGFKLAIDDFGVGHAEIKLLCDFPVDYLKIDRHFIAGLDASPRKRHLVRNLVNIAHVLGIRVIAEGVEQEAECLACREAGADMVQGWFIARPTTFVNELQPAYPSLADLGRARRTSQSLDEILIRRQIERLPTVFEHESIDAVFELFRANPRQAFFPVLNANGEPRGIISEHHLKEFIYRPFGRDLLKNKLYERSIAHFVEGAPIIGLDANAERLMTIFANMDGSDCVILTENMRYAGVVSAASLIRVINEKQLQIAQDQNPLTGLPGNRAIRDFMLEAGRDDDQTRFFCYCDFDFFKPFNDHYGFQMGDHAITLFAALMKRYFFSQGDFLGHVGGDDFFIGLRDWTWGEAQEILGRLLSDFHDDVVQLYSSEDRASGRIRGHDRNGIERDFPLLRCSIGVVELPKGLLLDDVGRIGAAIAGVKAKAKDSEAGLAVAVFDPHL
ncbi:EAL domain-containing protein [Rhizobium lemnae]|uniref:GGDEF domain-containing protein n=1 Tax=Rhizobium lemnae TaxID=1214924 RepID=A0ABV8ECF6_9HYPH|nr:EAL domain-containing protein [Rhizobium lemnae]MCJ8509221.1 EAL domain-containing protein [Rhizobium lemnae]